MRLGYFSMPMHPRTRNWAETLREDREAVILADRLGYHDAFIGEHLTDRLETVTSSMIFLASLVADTEHIRLGTGTANLSHTHPVLVAAHAAMLDHLSEGRLILGVSAGALPSDAEVLGILDDDRNKLFAEAIDVILEIWDREPPYDVRLPDNRFVVTTERTFDHALGVGTLPRPLQTPRPEIVGTVVAPFPPGAIAMGRRDFHPLSANFLMTNWLPSHWDNYSKGKAEAGQQASVDNWRVARTVFVADSAAGAREYGKTDSRSPYRFYYGQMLDKMRYAGRLNLFKRNQQDADSDIDLDDVLDELVIVGTPEEVAAQIVDLAETIGDFGELVYGGVDWVDPELARRSMELMATEVMPLVDAELSRRGS